MELITCSYGPNYFLQLSVTIYGNVAVKDAEAQLLRLLHLCTINRMCLTHNELYSFLF
jgi:hypothetical protein